jgi:drug/metabolite transporter (DMT)-like permease
LPRHRAILFIACAAILFSTAGLLIKLLTIGPLALSGGRSLIAAGVIFAWLRRPRFSWSKAQIGGAIALAATQILFVIATRETSAANAVFIQFTAPVYVAFLGKWILKEHPRRVDWLAIAAIGGGLYFFFEGELTLRGAWGNLIALVSGITLALLLLSLRLQKEGGTTETMLLGNLLSGGIGLPFLLMESPTAADWGGMLFLGVLQLGIPFLLMSIAIQHLTALETILVQTIEPVLNPIWVFLVIGELPTPLGLLGAVIVLVTVTARSVIAARQPVRRASISQAAARRPPLDQG